MSKNIGLFNVCLDIINSDGKDEKNWELLLSLINKEPKKNITYLINEFFKYISNNNFNKEIIYDILDYIIDNCKNLEILNKNIDLKFIGLLIAIIQKKEVEKDVKITILFLLQKWKNININSLFIYDKIKKSNIILPPKGFQIDTYKKYLKQEIFDENNNSNFYDNNKLDNQENSNKIEYENKKIIKDDDNDFTLLNSMYDLNSNQNNQNNNNYNNYSYQISNTSYSNSNFLNNDISNQNNNNLQNQNNNYNNQQNYTPNQNNNYQNYNYPPYNQSNQNNNHNNQQNYTPSQNNNYQNYNYPPYNQSNQNNNNRNYNTYPPYKNS
jgi:hypothetical protein